MFQAFFLPLLLSHGIVAPSPAPGHHQSRDPAPETGCSYAIHFFTIHFFTIRFFAIRFCSAEDPWRFYPRATHTITSEHFRCRPWTETRRKVSIALSVTGSTFFREGTDIGWASSKCADEYLTVGAPVPMALTITGLPLRIMVDSSSSKSKWV